MGLFVSEVDLRAEADRLERTIDELLLVIEGGQPLNRDAVERSISMLRAYRLCVRRSRVGDGAIKRCATWFKSVALK